MFIDHDGGNHQSTYAHVWPYPDAQGAVGIPFKSVVDVGTWTIYYSDRARDFMSDQRRDLSELNETAMALRYLLGG